MCNRVSIQPAKPETIQMTFNSHHQPSRRPAKLVQAFAYAFLSVGSFAAALQPGVVEAKWTRTHASACMSVNTTLAPYDTSYAVWNNSTTTTMTLLCDLSDTDYLAKTALTTLNIHGKDGSSTRNVDAMACRSNWSTTGGACSAVVSSPTGTSDYTLKPNLSVFSGRTADFGYVWVRLPPKIGSSRSGLRGFFTSN